MFKKKLEDITDKIYSSELDIPVVFFSSQAIISYIDEKEKIERATIKSPTIKQYAQALKLTNTKKIETKHKEKFFKVSNYEFKDYLKKIAEENNLLKIMDVLSISYNGSSKVPKYCSNILYDKHNKRYLTLNQFISVKEKINEVSPELTKKAAYSLCVEINKISKRVVQKFKLYDGLDKYFDLRTNKDLNVISQIEWHWNLYSTKEESDMLLKTLNSVKNDLNLSRSEFKLKYNQPSTGQPQSNSLKITLAT